MDKRRLLNEEGGGHGASYKRMDSSLTSSLPSNAGAGPSSFGGEALYDTPEGGLSSAEADARFRKYGPNGIPEKKVPLIKLLFDHYINNPMQYMILAAAVLSGATKDFTDLIIMLVLLSVNGTLGFIEERNAGDAVQALKKSLAPKCRCYRDGALREMDAAALVPGDRVMVKLGDIIPADGKLLDGEPCTIDESALTGESLPVTKYPGDEILAGAVMKTGETDAVITKTGVNSFLGKSASLVASVQNSGHLQKVLFGITMAMVAFSLFFIVIIIGVTLSRGVPFTDVLQLAVVVLIASIPIATPVVATSTMAVGSRKMARANAIVSRLAAIEEMAGMNMLCSDKTGTLTKNILTVEEPYCLPGVSAQDMYLAAVLASKREHADAIDTAMCKTIPNKALLEGYSTEKFLPFDPVSKKTEAHIRDRDGNFFKVTKGAPQVLFEVDGQTMPQEIQDQINDWVEKLAGQGLRPLGVARTDSDGNWQYLGLISLFDPPREDTRDTIEKALELGVDVKMVTGDHLLIGMETARKLGMGTKMYGNAFFKDIESKPRTWVRSIIENADGFAQVYPEHKYFIVEQLQMAGYFTGMTGDGVNDAPALKKADVGIAVEGATDAARAAADIILVSPGLSTIITAMIRSRKIFQRLKNYLCYRIAATTQILIFTFIAVMGLKNPDDDIYEGTVYLVVPALVLILLTIINDGTMISIAYDKVFPNKKPEAFRIPQMLAVAAVIGLLGVAEAYIIYWAATQRTFLFNDGDFPTFAQNVKSCSNSNDCTILPLATQAVNCQTVNTLQNFKETDDSTPNQDNACLKCLASACSHNTRLLKACVYISLGMGGQFSVYAARTHKFFFSRRPGYALLLMSGLAQFLNLMLGVYWFFPGSDVSGVGWKRAFIMIGFLLLTFVIKDICKVIVYALMEYEPANFNETRKRRELIRKLNLYGTADEEQVEKLRSARHQHL